MVMGVAVPISGLISTGHEFTEVQMQKSPHQKQQVANRSKVQFASAMKRIRAQYLAAGVTPQELAEIERVSATGDRMAAGLTIALVLARLEDWEQSASGADK